MLQVLQGVLVDMEDQETSGHVTGAAKKAAKAPAHPHRSINPATPGTGGGAVTFYYLAVLYNK